MTTKNQTRKDTELETFTTAMKAFEIVAAEANRTAETADDERVRIHALTLQRRLEKTRTTFTEYKQTAVNMANAVQPIKDAQNALEKAVERIISQLAKILPGLHHDESRRLVLLHGHVEEENAALTAANTLAASYSANLRRLGRMLWDAFERTANEGTTNGGDGWKAFLAKGATR